MIAWMVDSLFVVLLVVHVLLLAALWLGPLAGVLFCSGGGRCPTPPHQYGHGRRLLSLRRKDKGGRFGVVALGGLRDVVS